MKFEIENIKLQNAISILDKLPLKGLKSINRTRLKDKLVTEIERVSKEEKELKEEYCNLDDEGKPNIVDGKYDIKDLEAFKKELQEFYDDKVVIEGGDNQTALKSVKQSLEDCEQEWQGKDAQDFADLYLAIKGEEE